MSDRETLAKQKDYGKALFWVTGVLFILYAGFLVYFLFPQVNAGVHSLLSVILISLGIAIEGGVICSQARQSAPKFLAMGIVFAVINLAGLVLFSLRWTLCWPFIIGTALSASYIAGGFVKKRSAGLKAENAAQEE
jgi:type IV secretory pathway VirB2 component (pilin)